MSTIIKVDNLSKKFSRSLKRSLYYGVRDLTAEFFGRRGDKHNLRKDEFWALKNISLEIKSGETIGLIGRNGAGKTTLLRLLNGLIKPDVGRIEVSGRMQALIALGAGFNPVLTGRENIYINAAVFGIPKSVVDRRFDEIVSFSGIEEFIDTPVQSYSSGMAVRLGFSVAVHMEPDILLVDEVLAVGDIPFRAKCFKKLGEFKDKGIPWILVSHNMGTIRNLTNKAVFLDRGEIKYIGSTEDTISHYLYSISEKNFQQNTKSFSSGTSETPRQEAIIKRVKLLNETFQEKEFFETGETIIIQIDYEAFQEVINPSFGIHFYGSDETCFSGANTSANGFPIEMIEGEGRIFYRINSLPFLPGIYRVRADIWDTNMGMIDKMNQGALLKIKGGDFSVGLFFTPGVWDFN